MWNLAGDLLHLYMYADRIHNLTHTHTHCVYDCNGWIACQWKNGKTTLFVRYINSIEIDRSGAFEWNEMPSGCLFWAVFLRMDIYRSYNRLKIRGHPSRLERAGQRTKGRLPSRFSFWYAGRGVRKYRPGRTIEQGKSRQRRYMMGTSRATQTGISQHQQ